MSVDSDYRHAELPILFHPYEKCPGDDVQEIRLDTPFINNILPPWKMGW